MLDEFFAFLGDGEYNLSVNIKDKCFSVTARSSAVSFLAFNADLNTQVALTL